MEREKLIVCGKKTTYTEVRVLILDLYCNTRQEVADLLGSSIHTIDTHIRNICRKYDFHNLRELHRFGHENGFFEKGHFKGEYLFADLTEVPWSADEEQMDLDVAV